ncbi:uncharacterized protein FIESC28_00644 [Fusarium coffeatum]|uniref:F-box domain-containing protein n=1 Tax=Fusarium coffeatum TaxID=231269 RepID=A0A366SCC7_9HYPO|nr:uncharacterized protein FIESC28_00644 [Fusarium coffeatum]RBR26568.1 hypothetical protein FIESC28_00644 [Fusarium coffeatum]
MSSSNDPKGWHKLPFELRLEIIEFAIAAPELPIPSTAQEGRTERYNHRDWVTSETWGSSGLWEEPAKTPTANLLLVNKQFHNDVKYILDLLPNAYHVDVMVVKDYGLWPTWYCLKPPSSDVIEEVTVTFRIFEPTNDLDDRFKESLTFWAGDGGPEAAVWPFHQLFLTLTSDGLGLFSKNCRDSRSSPPKYIVKRIKMNILSPTDGVAHTRLWCREGENPWWLRILYLHRNPTPAKPGDQLADFIARWMFTISRPSTYTYPFVGRYYQNLVEDISLQINGAEHARLDPDQALKDTYSQKHLGLPLQRWCRGLRKTRAKTKQRFEYEERPKAREMSNSQLCLEDYQLSQCIVTTQ